MDDEALLDFGQCEVWGEGNVNLVATIGGQLKTFTVKDFKAIALTWQLIDTEAPHLDWQFPCVTCLKGSLHSEVGLVVL